MRYHDIVPVDMKNGTGLRVSLWLSGCDHRCEGCHNPITWDPNDGLLFTEESKKELFSYLNNEYIEGLTLTGGDPLFIDNRAEVSLLLQEVKKLFPDKSIWVYTGYSFEDIKTLSFLQYIDVLVDGKFEKSICDVDLEWRGSSNQRIILVKPSLERNSIVTLCD